MVRGDPVNPGSKGAFLAKAYEVSYNFCQNFLCSIFCIGRVT